VSARRVSRSTSRGALRRRTAVEAIAIVTSERRIVAMRVLHATGLLLAIAVHWLTR